MRVHFGECVFDSAARELRRAGAVVALSPKAFQLLEYLLESRPRALSKNELHDRLWPDTCVTASSLTRVANEVRAAVGDDARCPRFVRTVHRFGYAFNGQVAEDVSERPPTRFHLVWGVRRVSLHEGENVLGRSSEAVLTIDSPRVSRRHARIVVRGPLAVIEDLGSKNGTFLRGRRVDAPAELQQGDEICIGPVVVVFESPLGSTTTEAEPA